MSSFSLRGTEANEHAQKLRTTKMTNVRVPPPLLRLGRRQTPWMGLQQRELK
ncbi:hypothetical protein M378DRAFT_160276, partial [Amanita muscaria Koide BX008]